MFFCANQTNGAHDKYLDTYREGERSEAQSKFGKDDLLPSTKHFIFRSLRYLFADKKYLAIQLSVYLLSSNKFEQVRI